MSDEWTRPEHDSEDLAHISPDLRALAVPIESIFPDPDNARVHPERNMAAVMDASSSSSGYPRHR